MRPEIIALIILGIVLILFATEKLPLAVTALAASLAFGFLGIVPWSTALGGISNNATLLVINLSMFGAAFTSVGIGDYIVAFLMKFAKASEKVFVSIITTVATIFTAFFPGQAAIQLSMNVIDCVVPQSGGKITRKHTYMPAAIASCVGGLLTLMGAGTTVATAGVYSEMTGGTYGFFEITKAGLFPSIVLIIIYFTFGYSLQKKAFTFDEVPADYVVPSPEPSQRKTWKIIFTLCVMVGMILMFALSSINTGAITLVAALLLIITGCIDMKTAVKAVPWETVLVMAGALGFAAGFSASGAGPLVAEFMLKICGPLSRSPFAMCMVYLVLTCLMSEVMANTSTALVMTPIAIATAQSMGWDVLPFVTSIAAGASLAIATPICTSVMTVITSVGYRFKDFIRVGGVINLLCLAASALGIFVFYFI